MFSSAVSVGTRLNDWKINPTRSAQFGELFVFEVSEGVTDERLAEVVGRPGNAMRQR